MDMLFNIFTTNYISEHQIVFPLL